MGLPGVISMLLGGVLLFNTLIGVAELPYFIGVEEANWYCLRLPRVMEG
jgi:hypothetical protein